MIKNKCNYISGATAVPTDIIDKYLKLASAASFKVLLFILRNPDGAANAEQIAMCTGLAREDVEDCLAFWESNGVIAIDDKYDEEKTIYVILEASDKCVDGDFEFDYN